MRSWKRPRTSASQGILAHIAKSMIVFLMESCLTLQESPGIREQQLTESPNGSITGDPGPPRCWPTLVEQAGEGIHSLTAKASRKTGAVKPVSGPGRDKSHGDESLSICGKTHTGLADWLVCYSRDLPRTAALRPSLSSTTRCLVLPSSLPSPARSTGTSSGLLRSY